jgi:hypothetical protein
MTTNKTTASSTTKSDTFVNDLVGTCFICKRRHDNVGYATPRNPIKWLCWECLDDTHNGVRSKLPRIYHMSRKALDDYERRALEDGGNAGGSYLDEIGKTDLATLTEEEWATFWRLGFVAYADSMRDIVSREVPY